MLPTAVVHKVQPSTHAAGDRLSGGSRHTREKPMTRTVNYFVSINSYAPLPHHYIADCPLYTAVHRWRSGLSCCHCPYLLFLLLLLYGLNTPYVIHCDSEESQVWESHVTVGRHNLGTVCLNMSRPHPLCLFSEDAWRLSSSSVPFHNSLLQLL